MRKEQSPEHKAQVEADGGGCAGRSHGEDINLPFPRICELTYSCCLTSFPKSSTNLEGRCSHFRDEAGKLKLPKATES